MGNNNRSRGGTQREWSSFYPFVGNHSYIPACDRCHHRWCNFLPFQRQGSSEKEKEAWHHPRPAKESARTRSSCAGGSYSCTDLHHCCTDLLYSSTSLGRFVRVCPSACSNDRCSRGQRVSGRSCLDASHTDRDIAACLSATRRGFGDVVWRWSYCLSSYRIQMGEGRVSFCVWLLWSLTADPSCLLYSGKVPKNWTVS